MRVAISVESVRRGVRHIACRAINPALSLGCPTANTGLGLARKSHIRPSEGAAGPRLPVTRRSLTLAGRGVAAGVAPRVCPLASPPPVPRIGRAGRGRVRARGHESSRWQVRGIRTLLRSATPRQQIRFGPDSLWWPLVAAHQADERKNTPTRRAVDLLLSRLPRSTRTLRR